MKKIAIVALLSAFAAAPAAAENMYAGVKMGSAHHGYSAVQGGGTIKNNNQSGVGFFAGYNINEMFSAEAEYTKLGGFDTSFSTIQGSALGLSGVASFAIDRQFAAFGKLGISNSSLEDKPANGAGGSTITYRNTGVSVGLGVQYNATPAISIRGGFDIYPEGDSKSGTSSASLWYVGGAFKF